MPVTARLSRRFYDALGDEVAGELVEWFNAVDATYRSGLSNINELNFRRFDGTQAQRFAETDAKWEVRISQLETRLERRLNEQTRWMVLMFTAQMAAIIGLYAR